MFEGDALAFLFFVFGMGFCTETRLIRCNQVREKQATRLQRQVFRFSSGE
jgi:hypothetical protein